MCSLDRGVQIPGYFDPKTKKFIYVSEMVPEIVVPKDLEKCDVIIEIILFNRVNFFY